MELNLEAIIRGTEEYSFVFEIILRTVVMYIVILSALRFLGKRGVKQLSVFELVIIIGLGSAAGDPMFYKEVGLLNGIAVIGTVILCYKITTFLVFKSERIERLIEGTSIYLLQHGKFSLQNFTKEPIAYDEFFAAMRQYGITHLGQVDLAIIEISGEISLYYYADEDIKYGLPILPHLFKEQHQQILTVGMYSCSFCGFTDMLQLTDKHFCPVCSKDKWVLSVNSKRIT